MADDIVTQLRLRAAHATDDYLSYAAADEIERLREERDTARVEASIKGYRLDDALDEIERLRAVGDAMATNYQLLLEDRWSAFSAAFLSEWKEARRG